jgi:uncharacterized protein YbjT (DUF2867 family)
MPTLVTGASGFVGSLLVQRLQATGTDTIRAASRDERRTRDALQRVTGARVLDRVELVEADAISGCGLERALVDVQIAYYLIHSLERTAPGAASFADRERRAAENFAAAAQRAGVRRIVYLGGLVPDWRGSGTDADRARALSSRHLASRKEVERILLGAIPNSVALRASIIIGARSRSFRLMVRLVERMPVLALPSWRDFRTQPIDERDVIEMLVAAAGATVPGSALDIAGPDVLTYGAMLQRIAELMLVGRPAVPLGVSLTPFTARIAAAIVREDPELVRPLMEGLQGDLLAADDRAALLLGVRLHSFAAAVEHALAEWERHEPLAAR